jgi:TP901 family phage tail tape measure protein
MASELGVGYVSVVPAMSGFSKKLTAGMAPAMASMSRSFTKVGGALTKGLTLPILAVGAAAVVMAAKFGKGMANIATLIPNSTERVDELKNSILDLAPVVGKTTSDLTDGLYQVVSAFGDTSDSITILETNAKAATAGLASTTDAINLTSAVTKAYGDTSAAAVGKVADLGLLAVRLGQTTFPELASSIGKVTPMAKELNVSQEELFATMATFTGVTGGAAEVATQLRGALQAVMSPTADATKAFKAAGYESGRAAINELGMADAIGILTEAANASGGSMQPFIGSIEGQTFALSLAGEQSEAYVQKLAAMRDAGNITEEAFREMTTGVGETAFTFDQLKAKAEVMMITLGDELAPAAISLLDALSPLLSVLTAAANVFSTLPGPIKTVALVFGLLAVALGPVLIGLGMLIPSLIFMTPILIGVAVILGKIVLLMFYLSMAFLASPIGWVVMAVAALVAIFVLAYHKIDWFREAVDSAWQGIQKVVGAVVGWFQTSVLPVLKYVFSVLVQAVQFLWKIYSTVWGFIFKVIWTVVQWIATKVIALIKPVWDFLIKSIQFVWKVYAIFWGSIWNLVKMVATWIARELWQRIKPAFEALKSGLSWLKDKFVAFKDAVVRAFDRVKSHIGVVINGVKSVLRSVKGPIDSVLNWFGQMRDKIGARLSGIANAIKAPFISAFNAIKNMWNNTIGGFSFTLPSWVAGGLGGKDFSIPRMADGGTVMPSNGGTLAILAEAGKPESVVDTGLLNARLADLSAVGKIAAQGGAGGPREMVIVDINGQLVGRMRVEANGAIADVTRQLATGRIA